MIVAIVFLSVTCFCAGWLLHRLATAFIIKAIAHVVALSLADPSMMTHSFTYLRGLLATNHPDAFKNLQRCATCGQPDVTAVLDQPADRAR
jgi:hypothetical protein